MDFNSLFSFEDVSDQFDQADIENSKALAIIAYLIPFLFFLPYVSNNKSEYARFVSNQVLTIAILGFLGGIGTGIIGFIPVLGTIVRTVFYIGYFALMILGLVDAASGKARKLPVVGKFIIEAFK